MHGGPRELLLTSALHRWPEPTHVCDDLVFISSSSFSSSSPPAAAAGLVSQGKKVKGGGYPRVLSKEVVSMDVGKLERLNQNQRAERPYTHLSDHWGLAVHLEV